MFVNRKVIKYFLLSKKLFVEKEGKGNKIYR